MRAHPGVAVVLVGVVASGWHWVWLLTHPVAAAAAAAMASSMVVSSRIEKDEEGQCVRDYPSFLMLYSDDARPSDSTTTKNEHRSVDEGSSHHSNAGFTDQSSIGSTVPAAEIAAATTSTVDSSATRAKTSSEDPEHNNEDFKPDPHPEQHQVHDLISSFAEFPTRGQNLVLVQRQSPYRLQLDSDVTQRLRQRQMIHNQGKEELMDHPPWNKRRFLLPDHFVETALGHVKKNQTTTSTIARQQQPSSSQDPTTQDNNNGDRLSQTTKTTFSVPLLLKSHPNQAIVVASSSSTTASPMPAESGFMLLGQDNYLQLGIGSHRNALRIEWQMENSDDDNEDQDSRRAKLDSAHRFELRTDKGCVFILSADAMEGSPVSLTQLSSIHDDDATDDFFNEEIIVNAKLHAACDHRRQFIVHKDGSISPATDRHLVLGVTPYPAVTLVPRDSRHRLIFQNAHQFWSAPAPVNGTALILSSHPGLAVVPQSRRRFGAFQIYEMQQLGIGKAKDAIRLRSLDYMRHHEFLLSVPFERDMSMGLLPLNLQLEENTPVLLMRYNITEMSNWIAGMLLTGIRATGNTTWIVNAEGSISPANAPHLALGCEFIPKGKVSEVISVVEQSPHAWSAQRNTQDMEEARQMVTPMILRSLHMGVYILLVEDILRPMSFYFVLFSLLCMKAMPSIFWICVLVYLWYGSFDALLVFFFWMGFTFLKFVFVSQRKKKQATPLLPVPEEQQQLRP